MKVSYQWLSEYVDIQHFSPEQLADILTQGGLAVDAVTSRNLGVDGVVVGLVTNVEPHPDADRLHVCAVDIGTKAPLEIVCGAPNVTAGIKVPVAVPGARLPGDKMIEKTTLRGVASHGMLCSASEIGLETRMLPSAQTTGLYLLPDDAVVGESIIPLLHLDDYVLDVDLTPNRSDCLSIRGLAHEIAALTSQKTSFPSSIEFPEADDVSPLAVRIESDRCTRYDAQVLHGLAIKPSPLWMQMRLLAMGVRAIDIIVDVTNYVMLEWGQPLHAFDAGSIADGQIVVRQAEAGETLITLDGQTRKLDADMLVISDPQKAIGLAGVMGGENSEIGPSTSRVVIESAQFEALSTRRTGQKLGLRSEAQQRFEKGIDPVAVRHALVRTTQLLHDLAGAVPDGQVVAVATTGAEPLSPSPVAFSPNQCRRLLGSAISDEAMKETFARLGFTAVIGKDEWLVSIPTRRPDIVLFADLAEEVARLIGYDEIPSTLPVGSVTVGTRNLVQQLRETIRDALVDIGLFEVRTYAFTNPDILQALRHEATDLRSRTVLLMHPMSDERKALRTHLLPSLAEVAVHNISHRVDGGSIFEFAKTYERQGDDIHVQPVEREQLAVLWFGETEPTVYGRARTVDFFDAKGVLEHLVEKLGIDVHYERTKTSYLHPGRSANLVCNGRTIGVVGELHPQTGEALDMKDAIYAQLDITSLSECRHASISIRPLPRYPGSRRDLALLVHRDMAVGQVLEEAKSALTSDSILRDVTVFDVYEGNGVQIGQKSVAISLFFQADERTLTDEEIDAAVEQLTGHLTRTLDAHLRRS